MKIRSAVSERRMKMKYELAPVYSRKDKCWHVTSDFITFGTFASKADAQAYIDKVNEPKKRAKKEDK